MCLSCTLAFSYLLGSVPIGLIVGKMRGIDIRTLGSGNIGATNVLRTLGPGPAAVVFIGDTLKGFIPVLLANSNLSGPNQPYYVIAAGLLSILGHSASPFLGFKGGKGVATSLGVIIGLNPPIALTAFGIWLLLVALFRYVSLASIVASASVPVMMYFGVYGGPIPQPYTILALVAACLILLRHKSNIQRLLNHTEPKYGQKALTEGDSEDND